MFTQICFGENEQVVLCLHKGEHADEKYVVRDITDNEPVFIENDAADDDDESVTSFWSCGIPTTIRVVLTPQMEGPPTDFDGSEDGARDDEDSIGEADLAMEISTSLHSICISSRCEDHLPMRPLRRKSLVSTEFPDQRYDNRKTLTSSTSAPCLCTMNSSPDNPPAPPRRRLSAGFGSYTISDEEFLPQSMTDQDDYTRINSASASALSSSACHDTPPFRPCRRGSLTGVQVLKSSPLLSAQY